jgi:hypothetical protein
MPFNIVQMLEKKQNISFGLQEVIVMIFYFVQILYFCDRQYAQPFFLFSYEHFSCLYSYFYMFRVDRLIIRKCVNIVCTLLIYTGKI